MLTALPQPAVPVVMAEPRAEVAGMGGRQPPMAVTAATVVRAASTAGKAMMRSAVERAVMAQELTAG